VSGDGSCNISLAATVESALASGSGDRSCRALIDVAVGRLVRFWLSSDFDKYGILVLVLVSGTLTGTFKYRYRSVFSVPTALVVRLYA
jgi:hypothetical protein